ncbi:predicted protein, partial [Thalassiosira pseudonana CCMP1335]
MAEIAIGCASSRRVTMIKPTVGKVKTSAYALPDNEFVYGIESPLDKEGAGKAQYRSLVSKVIQSWSRTEPSKPPCSMQSFPATNRRALENGCLTSKAQREYGKQYPVMKQNPKQCTKSQSKASESLNDVVDQKLKAKTSDVITSLFQPQTQPQQPPQAFGIQSKKNKVSMTELLRCIPAELEEESDYPDLSGKKRKGRLPPAKST